MRLRAALLYIAELLLEALGLILLACSPATAADLWLYHDDLVPSTQDRLLVEAVCEPIDSLAARWPDHEPMRQYLAELEDARQELRSLGEVTVRSRDEANLHWKIPCPSLGLSEHEPPRPIIDEAFLHPLLIVRHLIYVSTIADVAAERFPRVPQKWLSGDCRWVYWKIVSRVTMDGAGLTTTETVMRMVPWIEPVPAVDLPEPPLMLTLEWSSPCINGRLAQSWTRCCGGKPDDYLRALGVGTGIVRED